MNTELSTNATIVLRDATHLARHIGHGSITPGVILSALLQHRDAAQLFKLPDADISQISIAHQQTIPIPASTPATPIDFSSASAKWLQLALVSARNLSQTQVELSHFVQSLRALCSTTPEHATGIAPHTFSRLFKTPAAH